MTDYEQPTVGRLSGGVAEYFYNMGITHRITRSGGAQVSSAITGRGSDSKPDTDNLVWLCLDAGGIQPPLLSRPFKRSLCITLLQIARNPFFFFRLVFLVTRRDAARLARRVGFWARRAGD